MFQGRQLRGETYTLPQHLCIASLLYVPIGEAGPVSPKYAKQRMKIHQQTNAYGIYKVQNEQ